MQNENGFAFTLFVYTLFILCWLKTLFPYLSRKLGIPEPKIGAEMMYHVILTTESLSFSEFRFVNQKL